MARIYRIINVLNRLFLPVAQNMWGQLTFGPSFLSATRYLKVPRDFMIAYSLVMIKVSELLVFKNNRQWQPRLSGTLLLFFIDASRDNAISPMSFSEEVIISLLFRIKMRFEVWRKILVSYTMVCFKMYALLKSTCKTEGEKNTFPPIAKK